MNCGRNYKKEVNPYGIAENKVRETKRNTRYDSDEEKIKDCPKKERKSIKENRFRLSNCNNGLPNKKLRLIVSVGVRAVKNVYECV